MQDINAGTGPNTNDGQSLRSAVILINENFAELVSMFGDYSTNTDLNNAINVLQVDINQLQVDIDSKAPINHTHQISQIIGLMSILTSKLDVNTFNTAIIRLQNILSQQQEVIAGLQRDTGVSIHNELEDIQGGTPTERYHLSLSQLQRVLASIYQPSTASLSVSPNSGERGLSTALNLTYNIVSNDDIFTAASINNGVGSVLDKVNAGSQIVSGGTYSNNVTFTLTNSFTRNGVSSGSTVNATYNTQVPQWSGISNLTDLNTSNYSGLTATLQKVVQANSNITRSLQPVSQYVWFVSTNANATITNSGFNTSIGNWSSTTDFFIKQTVTGFSLADGSTTANLTFYRTRQLQSLTAPQNFQII